MSKEDDSDSDSLPDLFKTTKVPKTDISAGDIVWAKFKNLYWPALVRHVYTKEKKITVWYTDDPGKTFKIPLKSVYLFHDREQRMKIEKEVREAGCVKEHEGITAHASMYLTRKALGYVDDPMKFFDQTYPFFLMEEMLKKDPDADINSIKIPHLYITPENKVSKKSTIVSKVKIGDDDSDIECSSSDESESKPKTKDYLLRVKQEYSSVVNKDKNTDEIVEFIKSGKADAHLRKIQSKRISSEYRTIYEKTIKCKNNLVSPVTYTGPIENDEKLRELIFYLLDFHDKPTIVPKNKRYRTRNSKTKFFEYPSCDKKCDTSQYVASVLLPEAIIYAMSETYKVSLSDAKNLFQEKSESKTKEITRIIASLGSEDKNNNSETSEEGSHRIIASLGSEDKNNNSETSEEESHNSNSGVSYDKPSKKPRVLKNSSKKKCKK